MNCAVVLAAGLSSRMGCCKQLLMIDNQPLVRLAAIEALAAPVEEVVVVTGYQADLVKAALLGLPVKTVFNPDFSQGQGTSLAAGIKAASRQVKTFVIMLADQPYITGELIGRLLAVYEQYSPLALRPHYRGQPGHPVIVSAALRPDLEALEGDQGASRLLTGAGGDRVMNLELAEAGIVLDLDTPEDLQMFADGALLSDPGPQTGSEV